MAGFEEVTKQPNLMAKWLAAMVGVFMLLGIAGVAFAAFTDTVTVNGSASRAVVNLEIVSANVEHHTYPGDIHFTDQSEANNAITLTVTNIVPGEYLNAWLTVKNTGTVHANLDVTMSNLGGLVAVGGLNGYDVMGTSGLWAYGGTYNVVHVDHLNPGDTYTEKITVGIPGGSDDSTPSTGAFLIVFTASIGT